MSSEKKPEPRSSKENKARTFQNQVYGSITQRLARENAERERFAREREKTATGRSYAMTFGELFFFFFLSLSVSRSLSSFCSPVKSY